MSSNLTISIVTVCKNDASGLEKTLKSVLQQSYPNIEHVIIDAASSDGSAEIAASYPHIKKHVSEIDQGVYDGMNKGIGLCEGDYILFLNSGDYLDSDDAIETIVHRGLDADIISCDLVIAPMKGEPWLFCPPETARASFLKQSFLPHPSTFFRRSLFWRVGLYDLSYRYAADYEFYVRALLEYKASYQHVNVALSVFNLNGMSSNPRNQQVVREEKTKAFRVHTGSLQRAAIKIGTNVSIASRSMRRFAVRLRNRLSI